MFTYLNLKRLLDLTFALLGLIIAIPILIIAIFLLFFSGEKSPLFAQYRVGLSGELFLFYKLRTMRKIKKGEKNSSLTLADDKRITFLGKFLRATKIDELPQLFNVIYGDLSIVGPRALMPEIFNLYSLSERQQIATIRPGITGLGSIIFRNEQYILRKYNQPSEKTYKDEIAPVKASLELWYIDRMSFSLDLKILFTTLWLLLYSRSKIAYRLIKKLPPKAYQINFKELI